MSFVACPACLHGLDESHLARHGVCAHCKVQIEAEEGEAGRQGQPCEAIASRDQIDWAYEVQQARRRLLA